MNQKPLVSICCITFNHENFIKDAIEGFLLQKTTFPIEIIIHDDASTDKTKEFIEIYRNKHPDLIIPIYQTVNQYSQGIKPLPNYVFPRARGKYIALCEGDDYWTDPYKLQKQVDFLENNEDYILCFTNTKIINSAGQTIKEKFVDIYKKSSFDHYDMPIFAPSLTRVFRNRHLEGLPLTTVPGGDTYLLVWQSKFGKIKFIDEVTSIYRRHSQGIYSSLNNFQRLVHQYETRYGCLNIVQKDLLPKFYKELLGLLLKMTEIGIAGYSKYLKMIFYSLKSDWKYLSIRNNLIIVFVLLLLMLFNLKYKTHYIRYLTKNTLNKIIVCDSKLI